jgi:hypothetical protein
MAVDHAQIVDRPATGAKDVQPRVRAITAAWIVGDRASRGPLPGADSNGRRQGPLRGALLGQPSTWRHQS